MSAGDRKIQILEAAIELFAFKGLNGVTTREIAKAAGISEPILYRHFQSKEEIYDSLQTICQDQTAYFHKMVAGKEPNLENLIGYVHLLTAVITCGFVPGAKARTKNRDSEILLRLMGYSFLESGKFAKVLVENCLGAIFDFWDKSFQNAFEEGHLNQEKLDSKALWLAYETIIGGGLFALPKIKLIPVFEDEEEVLKTTTLFILRGLGVKESSLKKKIDWKKLESHLGAY